MSLINSKVNPNKAIKPKKRYPIEKIVVQIEVTDMWSFKFFLSIII